MSQLKYTETPVQEEGNVSFSMDYQLVLDDQENIDRTIEGLIFQNIAPFVITQETTTKKINQYQEPENANIKDKILNYCRKDKSLAQLSRRFVNKFQGTQKNIIALDQVTQELNVERRRIYDIINIMESLNVVSKIKKNLYRWNGLIQAIQTIKVYSQGREPIKYEKNRKQKSLQSLASQFLRLFINSTGVLSLQEAADMILKNSFDSDSRKTKIRRLYDIVNVFKCIQLVEKTSTSRQRSGFRWKGTQELIKFIQEKAQNPYQSSQDFFSQNSEKQFKTQRVRDTRIISEDVIKSSKIEDTIETKVRQDIQITEFRKISNQSSNEKQMSFFQNMVKSINADKMNGQDLHRKFTELMWPK